MNRERKIITLDRSTLLIEWIKDHGSTLLYSIAGIIALLFLVFQIMGRSKGDAQSDYASANTAFVQWDNAREDSDLQKLQVPISRHPELHAKFDAVIAQALLSQRLGEKAQGYAAATLKRIEGETPYHSRFAQTTLLIEKGDFAQALSEAKQLKQDLEKDTAFWKSQDALVRPGSLLYAFDLLRIAMLEQKAGTRQGELAAWSEFEKNAGWTEVPADSKRFDPEAYQFLKQNFHDQEISLVDYIQFRKQS